MKPLDRMTEILVSVSALLRDVKDNADTMTLAESHRLYSSIREAEGWLLSVRTALEPEGTAPAIR